MIGRRLLFGIPRPDTHRGWLARHGGHAAASAAPPKPDARQVRPEFPFALKVDTSVSERVESRAVSVLAHAGRFAPRPIVYARMVIRTEHDRAVQRPATASVTLDVSGRVVKAHAAADTPLDALDLLERRLRRSLDRLDARRRARRRKAAASVRSAS